jgi:hypothetical protein
VLRCVVCFSITARRSGASRAAARLLRRKFTRPTLCTWTTVSALWSRITVGRSRFVVDGAFLLSVCARAFWFAELKCAQIAKHRWLDKTLYEVVASEFFPLSMAAFQKLLLAKRFKINDEFIGDANYRFKNHDRFAHLTHFHEPVALAPREEIRVCSAHSPRYFAPNIDHATARISIRF